MVLMGGRGSQNAGTHRDDARSHSDRRSATLRRRLGDPRRRRPLSDTGIRADRGRSRPSSRRRGQARRRPQRRADPRATRARRRRGRSCPAARFRRRVHVQDDEVRVAEHEDFRSLTRQPLAARVERDGLQPVEPGPSDLRIGVMRPRSRRVASWNHSGISSRSPMSRTPAVPAAYTGASSRSTQEANRRSPDASSLASTLPFSAAAAIVVRSPAAASSTSDPSSSRRIQRRPTNPTNPGTSRRRPPSTARTR